MHKKKILLVDDSTTIRDFERMILGEASFEFIDARDGEEALFVAARDLPDLILLDVNMPKIDGVETLRRLRRIDRLKNTPVIVITAAGESVERAAQAGGPHTAFVTKPLYAGVLNEKVTSFLAPLAEPPRSR